MRNSIRFLVGGSLVLAFAAFAWTGQDDARAIIEKSITATGGEKALAKHKAANLKEKGTYYGMGEGLPYMGSYSFQHPAQFRMEIENVFTLVFDTDKGWVSGGGEVKEMSKEQVNTQRGEQQVRYLSSLVPLRDKSITLKTLPDAKVENQDARVVQASQKNAPELKMYFDKKTHYLIKIEYKTIAEDLGNKEVTMDVIFSDFKDIEGAKVSHKRVVNREGKRFVEAEITEFVPVGNLDAKTFAKPQ